MKDFKNEIDFLVEADSLKNVLRKTLNFSSPQLENSAEHSWLLALAVLIFAPKIAKKDFDLLKAVKMALLHDIVEIDAGDTFIYDQRQDKLAEEEKAADRIFGILENEKKEEFKKVWIEFEEGTSPEAGLVRGLDRFLPLYSNLVNGGHSWKKHGIFQEDVMLKNRTPISNASPELWQLCEHLLEKAVSEGILKKRPS